MEISTPALARSVIVSLGRHAKPDQDRTETMATPQDPVTDVSDNAYALLGLLAVFGERSGYELKKIADRSVRYFFWSPSRSQVYRVLRQLEQAGYIAAREIEQTGLPDKRVYRLTSAGDAALRSWLVRWSLPPDQVKSPATLMTFFGDLMPGQVLAERLSELRRRAQADLARFTRIEAEMGSQAGVSFRRLALRRGIVTARETIAWVEEVLGALASDQASGPATPACASRASLAAGSTDLDHASLELALDRSMTSREDASGSGGSHGSALEDVREVTSGPDEEQ